ncbi:hypothetical protein EDF60_1708 [Leucobacter luti]|uniref:hypothetical protein n=1 Tax=Leucobacter luti TaxID=340320 RepID=UPI00104498CF|nr:hypothetical protein [Leucobacter luti]MCW2287058.1 hypothetical protein [Leucobacter luti]TCK41282.1 hypothetical protein EDF60_1708 [Leucobacter luti]
MTTLQDVEAWKNVAIDPTAIAQHPVKIQAFSPVDENVVIRMLITREHADGFFRTGLFLGLDVLIISATCWNCTTDEQLPVDETLFKAHIIHLLGETQEFAAFPHAMGSNDTSYRLMLVGSDQKPRIPTPAQMEHLWGPLDDAAS